MNDETQSWRGVVWKREIPLPMVEGGPTIHTDDVYDEYDNLKKSPEAMNLDPHGMTDETTYWIQEIPYVRHPDEFQDEGSPPVVTHELNDLSP